MTPSERFEDPPAPALQSDADLEAILHRALERSGSGSESELRRRLEQTAAELGISPEDLAAAEKEHAAEKQRRQEEEAYWAKHKTGFRAHLFSYLTTMVLLVVVNLMSSPEFLWVLFPLIGWGCSVAMHGWAIHFKKDRELADSYADKPSRRKGS
ncbi:MAG: 2TM domain-containing protein [Fimbriimonadaceae bacterium]|nr:2TM domain-containing protein [Fimbriimonadaceae bacterium]